MGYNISKSENFKRWDLCNDILNPLKPLVGKKVVPKSQNPYKTVKRRTYETSKNRNI